MKKIIFPLVGLAILAGCTNNTSTDNISTSNQDTTSMNGQRTGHRMGSGMRNGSGMRMGTGMHMGSGMRMNHIQITTEQQFLQDMIAHHQEAVDSSKIILTKTSNTQVKDLATNIVSTQQKEIDDMKSWLSSWYPNASGSNYMSMMPNLADLTGSQADKAYLQGMISHHFEATQLAKEVLNLSPKPQTASLAQSILSGQAQEMQTMQNILSTIQ